MSFLAPLWLGVAAGAIAGVVALHLITTQRPPPAPLPTARFVPQGDARASSRAARPTDLVLMLLRCAALLLLGAAFAGPVTRPRGRSLARVVVADRSRGAQGDVRDSAAALMRPGDLLVLFDSSVTVVAGAAQDTARTIAAGRARGSLTAGLVGARRAAGELARSADSVELVIVSPLTSDELDAASAVTFARWPGRARLVRTSAARAAGSDLTLVSDDADDALRPAIAAMNAAMNATLGAAMNATLGAAMNATLGAAMNATRNVTAARGGAAAAVRVLRGAPLAADSAAAREGATVVSWPRIGAAAASAQGLWAGGATLVAPLARLPLPAGGRVIARWSDGERAAAEWSLGRGCLRAIGAGVPTSGDVTLQPAFVAVARELLAPCGAVGAAAPDSVARTFTRPGPAATAAVLRVANAISPIAPWLVGAAVLLLIGEMYVRRDGGGAVR